MSKKKRGIDGVEEVGSHHDRESAFHSTMGRTKEPEQTKFGGSPNRG